MTENKLFENKKPVRFRTGFVRKDTNEDRSRFKTHIQNQLQQIMAKSRCC